MLRNQRYSIWLSLITVLTIVALPTTSTRLQVFPGMLDPSFGTHGRTVSHGSHSYDPAYGMALQSDGKIVVVGSDGTSTFNRPPYAFAVARYNADGSLDTSFGGSGTVTTSLGASNAVAHGVAVQTDGKIVVAGNLSQYVVVVRYNPDGGLDTSFGSNGVVSTTVGIGFATGRSVMLQPDGQIVVGGDTEVVGNEIDFVVVRYNPDGSPDGTFGAGGIVTMSFITPGVTSSGASLQPDGKIVLVGYYLVGTSGPFNIAMVRFTAAGSLDGSFGVGGKVTTIFPGTRNGNQAFAVALQSDGKIVVGGNNYNQDANSTVSFALARYNTDGSLDASFGVGGEVTSNASSNYAILSGLAIQSDGRIVGVGSNYDLGSNFVVVRYQTDGSVDTSFGTGGTVVTAFGRLSVAIPRSVVIQSDGKLVVAGNAGNGIQISDFAVARYLPGRP